MGMLNPLDLTGRRFLITGASAGIGRATAILLSQLGARLVLVARSVDRLEQVLANLSGGDHRLIPFDLSQTSEIAAWFKQIVADIGPLNGIVHCAGTQLTRPLRFSTGKDMQSVMSLNVEVALLLAKAYRQKGAYVSGGSIVFLSSVMGLVGQPSRAVYAASKGAIIGLTKSLAIELAQDGLRVNCVAPGLVQTGMADELQKMLTTEQFNAVQSMHPLGLGQPTDVANAIAFLLADTARWITGTTLVVDGGYTAQ
jgi:NAD(P)-dependent dehydrogenase (short-subunit alcohol dehydrogenase family)